MPVMDWQVSGRTAALLSLLGMAAWLAATASVVVGWAQETLTTGLDRIGNSTYSDALAWALVSGTIGFALIGMAAGAYHMRSYPGVAPEPEQLAGPAPRHEAGLRRLAGGAVVLAGFVITAVSWQLPWRAWHDEGEVINTEPAWEVFTLVGHVLVLAALGLLAVGAFSSSERWLYFSLALAVGGLGLIVYWIATPFFEYMQIDSVAWVGPGVPVATVGFLAVAAGAVLSSRFPPRRPTTSLTTTRVLRNGPGRTGLIFGILGILSVPLCFLGAPFGLVAVVLGLRGMQLTATGLASNRRLSVLAVVLGGVAFAAATALVIVVFAR